MKYGETLMQRKPLIKFFFVNGKIFQLEVERALLEGELVPMREKAAIEEERLAALLQKSQDLEERCLQERQHHQEAIEVSW